MQQHHFACNNTFHATSPSAVAVAQVAASVHANPKPQPLDPNIGGVVPPQSQILPLLESVH